MRLTISSKAPVQDAQYTISVGALVPAFGCVPGSAGARGVGPQAATSAAPPPIPPSAKRRLRLNGDVRAAGTSAASFGTIDPSLSSIATHLRRLQQHPCRR